MLNQMGLFDSKAFSSSPLCSALSYGEFMDQNRVTGMQAGENCKTPDIVAVLHFFEHGQRAVRSLPHPLTRQPERT